MIHDHDLISPFLWWFDELVVSVTSNRSSYLNSMLKMMISKVVGTSAVRRNALAIVGKKQRFFSTNASETALYTWGNGSLGALGHAKFELTPGFLEESYIQEEPRRLVKSKQYRQVACGENCTLALTDTGHLFGWGQGFLGPDSKSKEPQIFPGDQTYTSIAAGKRHMAAIDKNGMVYTWGYGDMLALGHGQEKDENIPKKINFAKAKIGHILVTQVW